MLRKSVIALFVISVILLVGCSTPTASPTSIPEPAKQASTQSAEDRYKPVILGNDKLLHFDTKTITFSVNSDGTLNYDIINVWFKFSYFESGVNEVIAYRRKNGLPIEGWKNLDRKFVHAKFNRQDKTYAQVEYIYYDKNDQVLDHGKPLSLEWVTIIPDSNAEIWYQVIVEHYVAKNWEKVKAQSK